MAPPKLEKKPVKFSNLLLGAGLNIVTTLGQPLEVVKTTMAANRADGFTGAIGRIWSRGGVFGFYQGLIPWAWIEASTKGAVLLFVASEAEFYAKSFGAPNFVAGISGGMVGGLAQAYATMGFCTCMKTVEITKHKVAASGVKPPGTIETFMGIYRKEGIRGINRGVNAVAVRQVTNWGSRFGLSRVAETGIRRSTGKEGGEKLSVPEKILASALGGGLSAWNQPIEVIRVEMQSKTVDPNRPKNLTVGKAFNYIYSNNGLKGLYRGVTPRIGLGVWQTVCMVALGDVAKEAVEKLTGDQFPNRHDAPAIKPWRCDLTALSRVHNLYFLACSDMIHVYQPSFPDQSLSKEPAFILNPPVSSPHLSHYVDHSSPHSITRLLVDNLGNDEILLATCDDGDVIGYRVEQIQRAVEFTQEPSTSGTHESRKPEPRTFLHRNVGKSAWGLAINRQARMIAISANTHEITVLAYALSLPNHESMDTENTPRTRDHVIVLSGDHNIPSISFNNTGQDPTGRWLVSSSISGQQMMWDLHNRRGARLFQMGWCQGPILSNRAPTCRCHGAGNFPHGAWGSIFLDPRSAHEVEKFRFIHGPDMPNFAHIHAQKTRFTLAAHANNNSDSGFDPGSQATASAHDEEAEPQEMELQTDSPSQQGEFDFGVRTEGAKPYCDIRSGQDFQDDESHIPLLLIAKDDIYLVQRPLNGPSDNAELIPAMRYPLYPHGPGFWSDGHERQCYHAQIPELGVFIIASPVGRAAIFSLTRSRKPQALGEGKSVSEYGFYLEYILPFSMNEENKVWSPATHPQCPKAMLLGVAVGPVQGMFDEVDEDGEVTQPRDRRWRLLMYYSDHSVLSFEIARKRVVEEPGLGDLVV
ncbi:mitochondrial carrier [Setomelanomma holmii]|uniref:Mitochondrial carrier n=1 Tax=Setomelanomma holmii TaxID=210430 RepID=A0A9P4LH31_9PLEO|nr:mitochondrial carrier [Setomelanomma holmii]